VTYWTSAAAPKWRGHWQSLHCDLGCWAFTARRFVEVPERFARFFQPCSRCFAGRRPWDTADASERPQELFRWWRTAPRLDAYLKEDA